MNKKYIGGAIVLAVAIACISFWGGMAYAKNSASSGFRGGTNGQFATGGGRTFRGGAGGFTGGTIIAKDATSITVKGPDGSTKIILIGSGTQVMKTASGTLDDLAVGASVAVTGSANSDGSITAEIVSLRPAGAPSRGTAPTNQ